MHDDLKNNPENLLKDFCLFLEIDSHKFIFEEKYNVAAMPKYKKFMGMITDIGVKKQLSKLMPVSLKKHAKKILFTTNNLPKITTEEKLFLIDIYKEDIQLTSKLINRDLTDWLKI